jgi:lysophospholipase L1-like esterase
MAKDMAPYTVIRRGYGGAKFSDVAYYAKRIILPHKFRALVLFVGNDVSGSPNDKKPEEVAACLQHIIDVVREQHTTVPIFCLDVRPTISRWKVWPEIQAMNSALSSVCDADPNAYFVATSKQHLDDNGRPKEGLLREDKLHLSRAGYELWTKQIKSALDDVLK